MAAIAQSLFFFSRYGLSLTVLFWLMLIPSEVVGLYLHRSLATGNELQEEIVDLMASVLVDPLVTGAAIFFVASRDQGGNLSLYESYLKSIGVYLPLATVYFFSVVIVLFGLSLYLIPGFYLLYKLMFVEFRVALKNDSPLVAIRASFNQTRDQYSLLLLPFMLLLAMLLLSRVLIDYLSLGSRDELLMHLLAGAIEAPFMALAVVVGFRLFSLTCRPQS